MTGEQIAPVKKRENYPRKTAEMLGICFSPNYAELAEIRHCSRLFRENSARHDVASGGAS